MDNKILLNYREFCANDPNVPPLTDFFEEKPYETQEIILNYLESNGRLAVPSTTLPYDPITKKTINAKYGYSLLYDGLYYWVSTLPYLVKKYNLRLPKEFEDYVLAKFQDFSE